MWEPADLPGTKSQEESEIFLDLVQDDVNLITF